MAIHTFPIGPLQSNCYLIVKNNNAIIVDPPEDYVPIMRLVKQQNLEICAIFCTHLHFDHVSGVDYFAKETFAKVYAGQGDIDMKDTFFSKSMTFGDINIIPFDMTCLNEGRHTFGDIEIECISTPGHTPGGLCFYIPEEKAVITGDTLFYRSVGRSDFVGGDGPSLINSIKSKLYKLDDNTTVYPGHGRETSILEEKNSNPFTQ